VSSNQEVVNSSAPSALLSRPSTERRQAVFALLGAALIWSTSFVTTKIALADVPPLTLGALRFILAAFLLGLLGLITRRIESAPPKDIIRLGAGGLLGITAYFALQNVGVQLSSAADATLLVASYPAITMLIESLLLHTRIAPVRFVGVAVTFVGVYLVLQQTTGAGSSGHLLGDVLLLLTGLVWALYNFVTRDVVQRYSMLTVIFWQTIIGAVAFIPLALLESQSWRVLSTGSLLSVAYMGVFCSIMAFLLYARGLKTLDAGSAVSLMNLVPVFGLVLAAIGLGESINLAQIGGGIIVIAGVALTMRVKSRAE
jgi:drug/metabolite transporter (DMT)-like permease